LPFFVECLFIFIGNFTTEIFKIQSAVILQNTALQRLKVATPPLDYLAVS